MKHYKCLVCGEIVKGKNLRNHLAGHSSHAEVLDWEDVRNQFQLTDEQLTVKN